MVDQFEVETRLAADLWPVVIDPGDFEDALLNLALNARDAMPEGGTLSVVTGSDSEKVFVEISDTGTGIREEHLVKIFDSFFTTKGEIKGVGLGLSVCYGFIKDHGGEIEVKSQVGDGTTFTISLPVHVAEDSEKVDTR